MKIIKLKKCLMLCAGLCVLGGVVSSTALVSTSCGKKNNDSKKLSYHYKEGQPVQLRDVDGQRSTIVILTLDNNASNVLKLDKRDALQNPKTHDYIYLTKLDEIGTWKIELQEGSLTSVGGFTIALEIIDPTNEQNRIDLNIEALAATDSLKYIPDEYLISERAYNESQNLHGGSENVLKAIDFDALEADSDYDTYDTLLIPDTFNSISGNLNISSHVNDCFTKIVNLNFVAYESTGISIGNNTFSGCTNFINIDSSGRTIDSIGGSTFADCTSLTTITIPEGSSISIGSEAFRDCTKLNGFKGNADSITLSSIGSAAFSGCTSLTFDDLNTIVSTASIKKITNESSGIAFRSSDGLTIQGCLIAGDFDLSDAEWSGFSLGTEAFYNCGSLKTIKLSEQITSIGTKAFKNCVSLESITFKDSPASFSVGSEAFYNCTKLSGFQASANSIVITSIGEYAFYNCSSLTFDGLNAITSVEGNKTTKIINGSNGIAFKSDDNLTIKGCLITGDCDLSNQNWSGFSIGNNAFDGCAALSEIIFDFSTTSIGNCAFQGCGNLKKIDIQSFSVLPSGFSIGSNAFDGCGQIAHNAGNDCIVKGVTASTFLKLAQPKGLSDFWKISN